MDPFILFCPVGDPEKSMNVVTPELGHCWCSVNVSCFCLFSAPRYVSAEFIWRLIRYGVFDHVCMRGRLTYELHGLVVSFADHESGSEQGLEVSGMHCV